MKDLHKCDKMKLLKKNRFEVHKYQTGNGWLVWDSRLKRTYRAFQIHVDAILCCKILNNNKTLNT